MAFNRFPKFAVCIRGMSVLTCHQVQTMLARVCYTVKTARVCVCVTKYTPAFPLPIDAQHLAVPVQFRRTR